LKFYFFNPKNPNINTGYFKKEIDYLKSKGFKLSVDGKSMIPPSNTKFKKQLN
jgi:hypothetical protein